MQSNPDNLPALIDYLKTTKYSQLELLLKIFFSQSDAEFDEGLEGILERAVDHLEKNANHLASLNEEQISAYLIAYLTMPGLRVTQEAHSNGHVDITIEAENAPQLLRRLGEAKIYGGPIYHVKGLEQLINRYTTGREGSGIMVEYVKDPGIKNLVEKVKLHMDTTKPCLQDGGPQRHRIRWAFMTSHKHSSGELVRILHLNCNLYRSTAQGSNRS